MSWVETSIFAPTCDKCGTKDKSLGALPESSMRTAQYRAETFGWLFHPDGSMYCPRCW